MPKTKRDKKIVKVITPSTYESINPTISGSKKPWKHIVLIAILLIGVIFWKFKGQFVVAMVNGQPVSRWQLNDQLIKKFGVQALESMINERLIISAMRQKGIFVTTFDINARQKQIENRLQGKMTLDDALKAQGMTNEDFKRQLEIQISIEKFFDKDASVSSKEVEDYIGQNKEAYKNATDPAALKLEVENTLKQQKIADLFEKWFAEIRKNAKIQKYL